MNNPPGRPKEKFTLKEAAFRIGVHWRTVYRWTLEGKVAYIQFNNKGPIYISISEIERLYGEKKLT